MYWINPNDPDMKGNCRAFYCDTMDDIPNLPTSSALGVQQGNDIISCQKVEKGSNCMVIGSSKVLVLNSHDEWKEL